MPIARFAQPARPLASIIVLAWKHLDLLVSCLRSLPERISRDVEHEVIVVANDARQEIKNAIRAEFVGIRLIEADSNLGFAGGCNLGASAAQGEYLVFLNDDAIVAQGWLDWLIATAEAHPRAGAVGSLVLFPDNTVQEAGMVIWSDGTAKPVGRGEPVDVSSWNFVRKVDYASASSLLVKRPAWEQLGGFDPDYHPAYYEDVDFSLALRSAGWEVWFDPRSRVWHHESASSDTRYRRFLFERNERRLRSKWADELALQEPVAPESPAATSRAIWRAQGAPVRVLAIQDGTSHPVHGVSGPRPGSMLLELAQAGYSVSVLRARERDERLPAALVSAGVALVREDLDAHLAVPWRHYDVVIVSGPHNFARVVGVVRRRQSQAILIYDCGVLTSRRIGENMMPSLQAGERKSFDGSVAEGTLPEEQIVVRCDRAVTVSEDDAAFLRQMEKCCPVHTVLPTQRPLAFSEAGFLNRDGVGYVAEWMTDSGSANAEGVRWFIDDVLPLIRQVVPWVRVTVAGACLPQDLLDLANPNLRFVGEVVDVEAFYAAHRVIIMPVRGGAGANDVVVQALQSGVPVVSTLLGAQDVDAAASDAVAVADDAPAFAEAVIRLISDSSRWTAARAATRACLERRVKTHEPLSWRDVIAQALAGRMRHRDQLVD